MARKPAKKSRRRRTPSKTELTPSPEGRLCFDEQGYLHQSGPVPLSRFLGALSDHLRLFLKRLDSCERTDAGDYRLRDARAGNLGGMRVLWDNVVLLAKASIAQTLPAMTPDQHAAFKSDGVLATVTAPIRNARPLADALRQLLFSIPFNADGSWVCEIPSATVAKLRTIADELPQHWTMWERSEGGTARTPMVSESSDLLDRPQRMSGDGDNATGERKRRRRKRPLGQLERPLTTLELHTLRVVGRHHQNFAAAARELNRNPKTVRENYTRALKKSNRIIGPNSRSVGASRLPEGRRGQTTI